MNPTAHPKMPSYRCLLLLICLPLSAVADVLLGIDVLQALGYEPLQGKRVGLLTHPAGVNREGISTLELLYRAPEVDLRALYGPEHGIDGQTPASEYIAHSTHAATGLPVYSLYNETRKPTPDMLREIDCMVIDLQDIGVRSYTFISAMKLTMEQCFEMGIEVVVLDRPNPLGGLKVDGPVIDAHLESYVGPFPIPYVHGLTIGELAIVARKTPGWLDIPDVVRRQGRLTVVPMRNWQRHQLWPHTGLNWVPTSPVIPDFAAVVGYSMTGLGCQIGGFRHGYGTQYPFRLLSHPQLDHATLAHHLRRMNVPGLQFRVISEPEGVYVLVSDWEQWNPTELSFHLMRLAAQLHEDNPFATATSQKRRSFNIHVGKQALWDDLVRYGAVFPLETYRLKWQADITAYQAHVAPHLIYP